MVDKLTLLFLSAELEMDDDGDEMNFEESVRGFEYRSGQTKKYK
jgi:hypothetical protein